MNFKVLNFNDTLTFYELSLNDISLILNKNLSIM
ncbi:hypothetical protein ACSSV5_001728 [Psychroflexus sp. MBR-150]